MFLVLDLFLTVSGALSMVDVNRCLIAASREDTVISCRDWVIERCLSYPTQSPTQCGDTTAVLCCKY